MARSWGTGKGQGGPNEGPDWTDVGTYIREIEKAHGATLTIELFTDGRNYVGTMFVRVRVSVPRLVGEGVTYRTEVYSKFPLPGHKTLSGLCLALLYQMDHRIGSELYTQRELPF